MPEMHFIGFGFKTKGMMWEVGNWIKDNIQDPLLSGHAENILKGAVLVGHEQTVVEDLMNFKKQPYVLVQSSDPDESEKLVELLSKIRLPILFDIVEGATLRRYIPKSGQPACAIISGQSVKTEADYNPLSGNFGP